MIKPSGKTVMVALARALPEFEGESQLFSTYEGLVKSLAFKVARNLPDSVDLDDLLQAGFMALIEAYRRYNGANGANFETYASIRVNGAMLDELRRTAFGSRALRRELRRAAEVIDIFTHRESRDPRPAEVAREMGLDVSDYHVLLAKAAQQQMLSLNAPVPEAERTLLDSIPADDDLPEVTLEQSERGALLHEAISGLSEPERLALVLYYYHGLNLREVGLHMGLSESRVCQLQAKATERLRQELSSPKRGS